jgi:hypothetical protein
MSFIGKNKRVMPWPWLTQKQLTSFWKKLGFILPISLRSARTAKPFDTNRI